MLVFIYLCIMSRNFSYKPSFGKPNGFYILPTICTNYSELNLSQRGVYYRDMTIAVIWLKFRIAINIHEIKRF